MNKFFISFAFASVAFLTACSEDKAPTPAELCKGGASPACLAGDWNLVGIEEDSFTSCRGTLNFTNEGSYSFTGKCDNSSYEYDFVGRWELGDIIGSNITILCSIHDCDGTTRSGKISVSEDGNTLTIKNNQTKAAISWYEDTRIPTPTEKFTRK